MQILRREFAAPLRSPSCDNLLEGTGRREELVAKHGLAALCRALFNATEFISVM